MKKITKRIVGLALTAGLALTVGAGVTAVYSSYEDTTITASAAESVSLDAMSAVYRNENVAVNNGANYAMVRVDFDVNGGVLWSNYYSYKQAFVDSNRFADYQVIKEHTYVNGKSLLAWDAEYAEKGLETDILLQPAGTFSFFRVILPTEMLPNGGAVTSFVMKAGWSYTGKDVNGADVTWTLSKDRMWTRGVNQSFEKMQEISNIVDISDDFTFRGVDYFGGTKTWTFQCSNVYWPNSHSTPNEAGGWFNQYILINGKSVYDWNNEAHAALNAGEITDITYGSQQGVIAGNKGAYAPIFVYNIQDNNKSAIQVHVPTNFIDPNTVTEVTLKAGYSNLVDGTLYAVTKDIAYTKLGDAWVNAEGMRKASDVEFSGGAVAGEANDYVAFNFKIDGMNMKAADNDDAYNWAYGGGLHAREKILINGKSMPQIVAETDDSGYSYGSFPFNNGGDWSVPVHLVGNQKDSNGLMEVRVHKDYLATLGDEVTITIANGFQNWSKDTTLTEDASQTYYKYADGSYSTSKMETVETTITEVSTMKHTHNFITFCLGDLDVAEGTEGLMIIGPHEAAKYSKVNFLDYIYMNGKPLSQSDIGEVIYNLAGLNSISIRIKDFGQEGDEGFDKNVFTAAIKTIEIKAGAQFPACSYAYEGGAAKAYTVTADTLWVYNGEAWEATEYRPYSIPEANEQADGTKVQVSGTVCEVNTAWSDQHGNITVTIVDENGNKMYVYRMKTNVTLGDIITVKGEMGTYNGRQIAAGSTATIKGHDSSYDYVEMTVEEALAAADGTNVIVTGTVAEIKTAYSEQYGNISVDIADENGTRLYLYRLSGNVEVGQIIKVKGTMATYNNNRQVTGATYEAIGTHECANYADGKCVVCGADEPAPAYIEVYLQPGDNTIVMAAGQYALAYMRAAGKFTFSWTGEATIMAGRMPIANGDVVEYNPMMGAFMITPVNAEAECTVVLTVAEYVAPTPELTIGENAIESNYQGVFVKFTATEAGKYVLKAAEGEENAWVDTAFYSENFGQMDVNWSSLRENVFSTYEFEAEAGEVVWFWVSTWNEMADTVNLVVEVAADEPIDPPTSEDPVIPPVDDSSSDEPTTSEPDDSSDEPTTSEPEDSSDEPTTSEPTDEPVTSEPTEEPEEEKKGGCGSVIGGVSAALTLIAAAAIVMKKKED